MFQAIHNTTVRCLTQPTIASLLFPLARILIALIFVMAGFDKLGGCPRIAIVARARLVE